MIYDVIVIGAGAAGLYAAANIDEGVSCLVLEKGPRPGRKLLTAGGGQCNITHGGNMRDFLAHYGGHGKIIRTVLYACTNAAVARFFEAHGIRLEEREDGKLFPESRNAEDILDALLKATDERNVSFAYSAPVTDIRPPQDGELDYQVTAGGVIHRGRAVIVAPGGRSFPRTGSDGSIMPILDRLQVPLIPQRPALSPISVKAYPYGRLSGVSFRDIRASILAQDTGKCYVRRTGDMLLTHMGFSGPVMLELSRYVGPGELLSICYLPGEDAGGIRRAIQAAAAGNNRQISTLLTEMVSLPARFSETLCMRVGVNPTEQVSRVNGEAIGAIAIMLTGDIHAIAGTAGFETSMVTAGGVDLDAINLRTLESKQYPGLYFAGEVLDVDGDTGGYNLQFAFSSGYVASRLQ